MPAGLDARLCTAGGRLISLQDPAPSDIAIADIAQALAHQCRFAGHVREFYSVAQHSVLVSLLCAKPDALWGLLHDASEAYLNDLVRPVKRLPDLLGYLRLEARLMYIICLRFGLPFTMPESVRQADEEALLLEQHTLVTWPGAIEEGPRLPMEPWAPKHARAVFLGRFDELVRTDSAMPFAQEG